MSWWDEFRDSLRQGISDTNRRTSAEVGKFVEGTTESGATSDADREAAWDKWIASLPPEQRAQVVAEMEEQRAQLEAMLVNSGYKGDVEDMSVIELARLAAERGLLDLSGDAALPTSSALAAAAAAAQAGGSWSLNPVTGGITIYKDKDGEEFHEYVPGGQEGRPAEIVEAEILGGSDPGEARPTREQLAEAAKIQADNPGSGIGFGDEGSVEVTRLDGTVEVVRNNPFTQGLEDLKASAGDLRGIGDALDGAARRGVEDLLDGVAATLGGARPTLGGGSAAAGMGGMGGTGAAGTTPTGTSPASTTTSTKTPAHSGYRPGDTQTNTHDSSLDPDDFGNIPTHGSKPASTSTNTTSTATPPAEAEPNEIIDRSDGDEPVQPDNDDGYRPSTITPPTDGTYVDTDKDGIPDDEEDDGSNSGTEYTPAPGDDERRPMTQEDLERLAELATARLGWKDGTAVKPAEYDPEFAARMQDRKLGMIGNPGDPDQDMGTQGGPAPERPALGGFSGPDDDTGKQRGHDLGHEDPMLDQPQGTLDPSILEDDAAPALAPQEMAVAELDPALVAPLATSVEAEVNIEGTPEIPDYHYALGDPVSTAPPPEEEEAIAARSDPRLGGQLSLASTFRLPTKDADEDPEDA